MLLKKNQRVIFEKNRIYGGYLGFQKKYMVIFLDPNASDFRDPQEFWGILVPPPMGSQNSEALGSQKNVQKMI